MYNYYCNLKYLLGKDLMQKATYLMVKFNREEVENSKVLIERFEALVETYLEILEQNIQHKKEGLVELEIVKLYDTNPVRNFENILLKERNHNANNMLSGTNIE